MENPSEVTGTLFKIRRFSVHDGPGIRTAVFLKGCPLNCIWCHSPEGISPEISIWYDKNSCIACNLCVEACPNHALRMIHDPEAFIEIDRSSCRLSGRCVNVCPSGAMQFTGYRASVDGVMQEVLKDMLYYNASEGGITLTGGEPLFQPEFAAAILEACRKEGIHTAVETSLWCSPEVISEISDLVDLYIADLKIFDPVKHEYYTGKTNDRILENFRLISQSGKQIIARVPLIGNITDTERNKAEILKFVQDLDENIPLEFLEYNPLAANNYRKLGLAYLPDLV